MLSWFELMRVSNAPTVASNVMAGMAIGLLARLHGLPNQWGTFFWLLAGALLVYVAGMILNDVFDARGDAIERPGRPIPSGRVARGHARAAGMLMLLGGTALLAFAGEKTMPWALLLGAAVLFYDVLHRQIPGSWLLLALCRALVIVIAALTVSPGAEWPLMGWVAGSLFVYVAVFSIAARDEVRGLAGFARGAARLVPVCVLAPLGLLLLDIPRDNTWNVVFAGGVLLVVAVPATVLASRRATTGRGGVPAAVGGWIGAIALMDSAVCFLADAPWLGLACIGLWGLAGAMRPKIAAS